MLPSVKFYEENAVCTFLVVLELSFLIYGYRVRAMNLYNVHMRVVDIGDARHKLFR